MTTKDVQAHVGDGGDVREHPRIGAPHRIVDRGESLPRLVSQTNTGSPTSSARPRAHPARTQRDRSQRAACDEQPIIRASCGSVTAYCSPTTRSNSRSRPEQRTVPASDRRARGAPDGPTWCVEVEVEVMAAHPTEG
jgi:hypothetical protein